MLLQVREQRDKIAGLLDDRAGGRAHRHAELVADHIRERRLAQTRGTVDEDVIERFLAPARGGNRHLEVVADAVLADVLVEGARTKPRFVLRLVFAGAPGGDQAIAFRRCSGRP